MEKGSRDCGVGRSMEDQPDQVIWRLEPSGRPIGNEVDA